MNLLQLRVAVRRALKDDTIPSSEIDDAINRVLADINSGGNYRFQDSYQAITTVAGQAGYNLNTTILNIGNVVYKPGTSDAAPLYERPDYPAAVAEGLFVSQGVPSIWSRDATKIYFDLVPSSVYTINVYNQTDISALVSDTDVPNVPVRYHKNFLVYGPTYQLALANKLDADLVGYWKEMYRQAWRDFLNTEKYAELKLGKAKMDSNRWNECGAWGNVGAVR